MAVLLSVLGQSMACFCGDLFVNVHTVIQLLENKSPSKEKRKGLLCSCGLAGCRQALLVCAGLLAPAWPAAHRHLLPRVKVLKVLCFVIKTL